MDNRLLSFLRIKLYNSFGQIEMGGAESKGWRIKTITGLGIVARSVQTATYVGFDGQDVLGEVAGPRTITITGDIYNSGHLQDEVSRADRILYRDITVEVQFGLKRRRATCRTSSFEAGERDVYVQQFSLQLIADDPAFYDCEENVCAIYQNVGLLRTSFTLPCLFSQRISEADIFNFGDLKIEPVICITCFHKRDMVSETSGINIYNTTADGSVHLISLETGLAVGETVTIDIASRKITSSTRGTIYCLAEGSFLSDFWLDLGNNHIVVENLNTNEDILAQCRYYAKYVEAEY